jgi:ABC-type multidrug transport system ATPase subunit
MRVEARQVTKHFGKQPVFRQLNLIVESGDRVAIVGSNGSGKTTFLRLLAGFLRPNSGEVIWQKDLIKVEKESWSNKLTYAAPYIELIEELELIELLDLHSQLRPFHSSLNAKDVLQISGLQKAKNKQIRHFSSGMKQRLRLVLALLTNSSIVFLDEPSSNLDAAAIDWMQELVKDHLNNRSLLIGSNHINKELELASTIKELHSL